MSKFDDGDDMPRLTIDVDEIFDKRLAALADGGTKADVIHKAVATYDYLKSQISSKEGSERRVSITDNDDKVQNYVTLP